MKQLFLISFLMSLVILPLLIHRKFRGVKFSSKVYYIIWIIIAIRLVLPFDISMENSIYKFSSSIKEYKISNYDLQNAQLEVKLSTEENTNYEDSGTNLKDTKKINFISTIRDNLFNIWLAGTILYFVYNSFFYLLFKYRVKKSSSLISKDIEEKFNDTKACMVPECFLQVLFEKSCKIFFHSIATPFSIVLQVLFPHHFQQGNRGLQTLVTSNLLFKRAVARFHIQSAYLPCWKTPSHVL
jgi:hypothetical protein